MKLDKALRRKKKEENRYKMVVTGKGAFLTLEILINKGKKKKKGKGKKND